jgi:hypothetical protein
VDDGQKRHGDETRRDDLRACEFCRMTICEDGHACGTRGECQNTDLLEYSKRDCEEDSMRTKSASRDTNEIYVGKLSSGDKVKFGKFHSGHFASNRSCPRIGVFLDISR